MVEFLSNEAHLLLQSLQDNLWWLVPVAILLPLATFTRWHWLGYVIGGIIVIVALMGYSPT